MYMYNVMQNKKSSSALGSGYYSGSSASSGYYSGSASSASYHSGSSSYYSGSSGTIGHSELTHSKSILGDYICYYLPISIIIYVVDMLNLKSFISPS